MRCSLGVVFCTCMAHADWHPSSLTLHYASVSTQTADQSAVDYGDGVLACIVEADRAYNPVCSSVQCLHDPSLCVGSGNEGCTHPFADNFDPDAGAPPHVSLSALRPAIEAYYAPSFAIHSSTVRIIPNKHRFASVVRSHRNERWLMHVAGRHRCWLPLRIGDQLRDWARSDVDRR